MKKGLKMKKLILLALISMVLVACGGTSDSSESTLDNVQQAVAIPVQANLFIIPGTTVAPNQLSVDLNRDFNPLHVSDCTSAHAVKHGTEGNDVFGVTTQHASIFLSDALWTQMATKLNTPGKQVELSFTYDASGVNLVKPLIGLPTFTLFTPL